MKRTILARHEDSLYKGERQHMLQYPGVCQIFIFACIVADAFTLFTTFDILLTQQIYITWVITITVASVMNISPMLLAAWIRKEDENRKKKILVCSLLTGIFLLLFAVTFLLRYTSRDQLYGSTYDLGILGQAETNNPVRLTTAQNTLAIILGLEPLLTSACSFVLSYEAVPKRKRRHLLTLQNIELRQEIDHDKVMLQELKEDMEYDIDTYDKNQYEEMIKIIQQQGELAKMRAVRKLAEHDATPEGISYLMEGKSEDEMSQKLSDETGFVTVKSVA